MKVFSAKRARYHLAATEKYAASYVKMCASPPPLVKKQFLDIIVEDAAKVLKRKAESAVKEDALVKKHKSTASALKQKQERQQPTVGQSLSGSVTLADESKWQHRTIIKVVYQGVRCGGHCAESVLHNHPDGLRETVPYIINEDLHAMIRASPHNTHRRLLSQDGAVAQAI